MSLARSPASLNYELPGDKDPLDTNSVDTSHSKPKQTD